MSQQPRGFLIANFGSFFFRANYGKALHMVLFIFDSFIETTQHFSPFFLKPRAVSLKPLYFAQFFETNCRKLVVSELEYGLKWLKEWFQEKR